MGRRRAHDPPRHRSRGNVAEAEATIATSTSAKHRKCTGHGNCAAKRETQSFNIYHLTYIPTPSGASIRVSSGSAKYILRSLDETLMDPKKKKKKKKNLWKKKKKKKKKARM